MVGAWAGWHGLFATALLMLLLAGLSGCNQWFSEGSSLLLLSAGIQPSQTSSCLQALAWAFECMEAGGPAAVARRTGMAVGSCGHGAPQADSAAARRRRAQRAQQEAQHRRLQEESARVLQRFVRTGMKKEQVQRIQRVQNLELYEDYCRWARDMAGTAQARQLTQLLMV